MGDARDTELRVGTLLDGKYEILGLLGAGGMGEVYKARHSHLNALRCIKVMKPSLAADEGFRARFVREARVATRVHHPNVSIVHDFALTDEGISYLVTEFIDGVTLREWTKHNGRFPVALAADVAIQVLSGLHEIHKLGLVHRDISSENIMIEYYDDRWVAKIIDLGIAKALEGPVAEKTQVGLFVGNPRYSSPEQLGDIPEGEEIDGRSDLYSLGVVMYEMVVGEAPFTSKNPHGYVVKHLKEAPRPLPEALPGSSWPPGFEAVLFKALEKKRTTRFATARDFARSLHPFSQLVAKTVEIDISEFLGQSTPTPPPLRPDILLQQKTLLDKIEMPPMEATVALPKAKLQDPLETARTVIRDAEEKKRREAEEAFAAALDANTPALWRLFLERHADSEGGADAQAILQALEESSFERFVEDRNAGALGRFIGEFPEGAHAAEARQLAAQWREEEQIAAAWESARREDATALYRAFVVTYPNSEFATEALRRVAAKDLLKKISAAAAASDRIALGMIVRMSHSMPDVESAAREAIAAIESKEAAKRAEPQWDVAWRAGSVQAFRTFLEHNPASRYQSEAEEALREAEAFEQAIGENDVTRLRAFLHDFPEGRHFAEVKIRADEMKREATNPGTKRQNADAVLDQLRASVTRDKKT